MGIFGGTRRVAPHEVFSQGVGVVEVTGAPQYITIQASGGAATILFADSSTTPGGTAWPIADGETVDYVAAASKPYMHVLTGNVLWHKS